MRGEDVDKDNLKTMEETLSVEHVLDDQKLRKENNLRVNVCQKQETNNKRHYSTLFCNMYFIKNKSFKKSFYVSQ